MVSLVSTLEIPLALVKDLGIWSTVEGKINSKDNEEEGMSLDFCILRDTPLLIHIL